MQQMFYSLHYRVPDLHGRRRSFNSMVKATSETVSDIVEVRGLEEYDDGLPWRGPMTERSLTTMIEQEGATLGALHMACFVGFVAIKAGVASVEQVLGDCGLIHEIIHNLDFVEGEPCIATRAELAEMAHQIEQAIPGHPYD